MPKISNKDIVLSIIHDYVKKSKSFTTHDVCASAKTYGCSLDNFKIKCIVKSAYYPIHYKITPIVINDSVFDVYHKDNVDPNIYNNAIVRKRFKKIPNVKRIKRMSSFDTSKQSKAEFIDISFAKTKYPLLGLTKPFLINKKISRTWWVSLFNSPYRYGEGIMLNCLHKTIVIFYIFLSFHD